MSSVPSIADLDARHWARGSVVTTWSVAISMLLLAGPPAACLAAEPVGGLGPAFRPQVPVAAPAAGVGASTAGVNPPGLHVVIVGPGRTLASIDGHIVHVGDTIHGMRVTQITLHGVVLTSDEGRKEKLTVNPSAIKRECPAGAPCVSKGVHP